MNSTKLVVNASPIISLAQIGYADLLLSLSSELVIPNGVYEEITAYSIDDRAAKRCAESFDIKVRGTIALIIDAKRKQFISEATPLLLKLKANGFRISSAVFDEALKLADEP